MFIVLTGKSGSGKNTILDIICKNVPEIERICTTTTRKPRPGEVDGVDYNFVSDEKFDTLDLISVREFKKVDGKVRYGLDLSNYSKYKNYIFILCPNGYKEVHENFYSVDIMIDSDYDVVYNRLKLRGTDSQKEILRRIAKDEVDFDRYKPTFKIENNGCLDETCDKAIKIVKNLVELVDIDPNFVKCF